MMTERDRLLAFMLAIAGIGACITALAGFLLTVVNNTLPWSHALTAREHYLEVGRYYSQGFFVGFFLCFFLSLIAIAVAHGVEQRRLRAGSGEAGRFLVRRELTDREAHDPTES
jgi:hypothetical protein